MSGSVEISLEDTQAKRVKMEVEDALRNHADYHEVNDNFLIASSKTISTSREHLVFDENNELVSHSVETTQKVILTSEAMDSIDALDSSSKSSFGVTFVSRSTQDLTSVGESSVKDCLLNLEQDKEEIDQESHGEDREEISETDETKNEVMDLIERKIFHPINELPQVLESFCVSLENIMSLTKSLAASIKEDLVLHCEFNKLIDYEYYKELHAYHYKRTANLFQIVKSKFTQFSEEEECIKNVNEGLQEYCHELCSNVDDGWTDDISLTRSVLTSSLFLLFSRSPVLHAEIYIEDISAVENEKVKEELSKYKTKNRNDIASDISNCFQVMMRYSLLLEALLKSVKKLTAWEDSNDNQSIFYPATTNCLIKTCEFYSRFNILQDLVRAFNNGYKLYYSEIDKMIGLSPQQTNELKHTPSAFMATLLPAKVTIKPTPKVTEKLKDFHATVYLFSDKMFIAFSRNLPRFSERLLNAFGGALPNVTIYSLHSFRNVEYGENYVVIETQSQAEIEVRFHTDAELRELDDFEKSTARKSERTLFMKDFPKLMMFTKNKELASLFNSHVICVDIALLRDVKRGIAESNRQTDDIIFAGNSIVSDLNVLKAWFHTAGKKKKDELRKPANSKWSLYLLMEEILLLEVNGKSIQIRSRYKIEEVTCQYSNLHHVGFILYFKTQSGDLSVTIDTPKVGSPAYAKNESHIKQFTERFKRLKEFSSDRFKLRELYVNAKTWKKP